MGVVRNIVCLELGYVPLPNKACIGPSELIEKWEVASRFFSKKRKSFSKKRKSQTRTA
jgi:hypothetical protein